VADVFFFILSVYSIMLVGNNVDNIINNWNFIHLIFGYEISFLLDKYFIINIIINILLFIINIIF